MITKRASFFAVAFLTLSSTSAHSSETENKDPFTDDDSAVELQDLYVWPSADLMKVNLAVTMRVSRSVGLRFPKGATFAFHVTSSEKYGTAGVETNVICRFYDFEAIECWAADLYAAGQVGMESGVTSIDGRMRVFAGLRDNPAFFDLKEFLRASDLMLKMFDVPPPLTPPTRDEQGCIKSTPKVANLGGRLRIAAPGGEDSLQDANVMALVLQLPKEALVQGGPVLGVWAGAHFVP